MGVTGGNTTISETQTCMALLEKTVLFDKYRIIQQLDKNNFMTVYLGEHLQTSEYILIHIMNPYTITKSESERASLTVARL